MTYQVDMDWLTRRCPVLRRIPWTLVHGERNPRQVRAPIPLILVDRQTHQIGYAGASLPTTTQRALP